MPMMKIQEVLRSGGVTRYHAQPEIPAQTLAEHQWGVSILVLAFYPDASKALLSAALTHDCAELVTGDTPSPMKRAKPEIKALLDAVEQSVECDWSIDYPITVEESQMLKTCDMLEGMRYCADVARYDPRARPVVDLWIDYLSECTLTRRQEAFMFECRPDRRTSQAR